MVATKTYGVKVTEREGEGVERGERKREREREREICHNKEITTERKLNSYLNLSSGKAYYFCQHTRIIL